ncbi:hypothetical protein [Polyangium sp. 15x6]|uniref:hypothetical protein n=1 Tax=Polyangium sp. 15x6 TaxID=3042687 RepID=UPI00249A11B6|nr:hypothetical protein [Polyangium sp. 15x6]MDI3291757.1 hypothetical protein [Polyangium sp. 15x6]
MKKVETMYEVIVSLAHVLLLVCALAIIAFLFYLPRYLKKERIFARVAPRFGFRIGWKSAFGTYCLYFERPGWGGVLLSTDSPGVLFNGFRFVGVTTRAHHALDVHSSNRHDIVSDALNRNDAMSRAGLICESPEMVASFNERIRPLLRPMDRAIAGEFMRVGSPLGISIKGCRVQFAVSESMGDEEKFLIHTLKFIETIMQWLEELPVAASDDTCRACGAQGDGGQCGRCRSPYHNACWQQFGGCQVWGCRDNHAQLESIRRPMLSPVDNALGMHVRR